MIWTTTWPSDTGGVVPEATDNAWPIFEGTGTSTTYSIQIWNRIDQNTKYSITVLKDPVLHEGTLDDPVILTPNAGTPHLATTSSLFGPPFGNSFYRFTLDEPSNVDITYENGELSSWIYPRSANWSGEVASENDDTLNHLTASLAAGTYDVAMSFSHYADSMTTYRLAVNASPSP